jgi:hypothetical protein
MTQNEFGNAMDKLKAAFGSDRYPDIRLKIYWREFKDLDADEFDVICDEAIANNNHAPPMDKFKEYAKTYFAKHFEKRESKWKEWLAQQPYCRHCDMSGILFGVVKKTGNKCVFRCPCIVGGRVNQAASYFEWNVVEFGDTHEITPFADEGFDRRTAKPIGDVEINKLVMGLRKAFSMKWALTSTKTTEEKL